MDIFSISYGKNDFVEKQCKHFNVCIYNGPV